MARQLLHESQVISVRIEKRMYEMLRDLASLESLNTGRNVTVMELIRTALTYVYEDNERLREAFRRSRAVLKKNRRD